MSRFLLLLVFVLWKAVGPADAAPVPPRLGVSVCLFLSAYLLIVLAMRLWSQRLVGRLDDQNFHRSVRRFNQAIDGARIVIPVWFGVGMFLLGWPAAVERVLAPIDRWGLDLPGLTLGTLPALLAWMGLWWSQYPADRALREQSLGHRLDLDLPARAVPSLGSYFMINLRIQLLFTIVPVVLVFLVRDVFWLVLHPLAPKWDRDGPVEAALSVPSALAILLVAPEILRRVVPTEPMPAGELRGRLEALCDRHRLGFREILLWNTQGHIANALVMGLHQRVRYILMSDLLLETMTDEQIEAVFAHEIGHVQHRHLRWYLIFFVAMMLFAGGPALAIQQQLQRVGLPGGRGLDLLMLVVGGAGFFALFGYLSRKFERQADVFAARTLQRRLAGAVPAIDLTTMPASTGALATALRATPRYSTARIGTDSERDGLGVLEETSVGPYGAAIFSSALRQVAMINNIPIAARSWCHGSIAQRIRFLNEISRDPELTRRFDRFMWGLYAAMIIAVVAAGAWTAAAIVSG
jgi:STE24 endopeptidase